MKRIFTNKIVWVIAILTVILFIGLNAIARGKNGKTKKETTYIVKNQTIRQTLTISGTVESEEKATLRFQNSGSLAWVGVKEGDTVHKYQAIASLDQQELKKTLEKYLNTYEDERRDFEQTKEEYRQPAQGYWGLSWDQRNELDRALQKAQFDLNSAVLDVELKNIALRYATLTTPIDGVVTKIGAPYAGVNITPAQAEFEIINPASLYLSVLPDQNEVTEVSASMSADIVFDAFPDEHVTGNIETIAFTPKSGETSTVYEVKVQFPLIDFSKYRMGMTADATFTVLEEQDVLAIPSSFLKTDNGKHYVMKKTAKGRERQNVEIGVEADDMVEIRAGLAAGDILYD